MSEPKIIILKESLRDSIARDTFSVISSWAMIFPGWWIDSAVMQWIGLMMFVGLLLVRAAGIRKRSEKTLDEAETMIRRLRETPND